MSDWDERAEDHAAAAILDPSAPTGTKRSRARGRREGFVWGARWQRSRLLSDETVDRAARAVAGLEPGEDWPTNAEMGGGPTGTRDDEYRSECVRTARAALTAALGEDENDE